MAILIEGRPKVQTFGVVNSTFLKIAVAARPATDLRLSYAVGGLSMEGFGNLGKVPVLFHFLISLSGAMFWESLAD